jgi:hypothetical protein
MSHEEVMTPDASEWLGGCGKDVCCLCQKARVFKASGAVE